MIHPSHSRKDLLEVIKVFHLKIKNSEDLNKNELSRMLWLTISKTDTIDPDNNYFFINNVEELKHFLVNHNVAKLLTIKEKERIIEDARRIISYSISGFNLQNNFTDINELISIAVNISKYGDISSVRRALKLLQDDKKIKPSIFPIISKRVEKELERKKQIKDSKNNFGLKRNTGNYLINFD